MDAAIRLHRKGPPPAVVITLSPEERAALEHFCRAGTTERRLADRAQVVLLAVLGWSNMAIAAYLHRTRYWVQRWRQRFARERLPGLADRPRSGRPPRLSPPAAMKNLGSGGYSEASNDVLNQWRKTPILGGRVQTVNPATVRIGAQYQQLRALGSALGLLEAATSAGPRAGAAGYSPERTLRPSSPLSKPARR